VALQPHCPFVRQTFPKVPAVQLTQVPLAPQAVEAVPGKQVPLEAAEQQPVWQGADVPQGKVQRWVALSQETALLGQLAMVLHPHCPPPVTATQRLPAVPAVYWAGQSRQAPPLLPHAALAVPATQVPFWQQPPLQTWVALQVLVQTWVVVLQA